MPLSPSKYFAKWQNTWKLRADLIKNHTKDVTFPSEIVEHKD